MIFALGVSFYKQTLPRVKVNTMLILDQPLISPTSYPFPFPFYFLPRQQCYRQFKLDMSIAEQQKSPTDDNENSNKLNIIIIFSSHQQLQKWRRNNWVLLTQYWSFNFLMSCNIKQGNAATGIPGNN